MERVYLLLRNNQQSGPFTIGELWQQQLKPTDMIWIEGKSNAWTFLAELELTPFIASSLSEEKNTEKAEDEIERKAEELRQKILSSSTSFYTPRTVERESYASPYYLSDNELEFVDHRKERRARKSAVIGELALTGVVVGLFALGIYKGKSFLGERKQVETSVATKLNTNDEHTAQRKHQEPSLMIAAPDTTHKLDSSIALVKPKLKKTHVVKPDSVAASAISQDNANSAVMPPNKKEDMTGQIPVEQAATVKKEDVKKEDAVVKKATVSSDKKEDDKKSAQEPGEKKKGFFLTHLFKKKKKEAELQNQ